CGPSASWSVSVAQSIHAAPRSGQVATITATPTPRIARTNLRRATIATGSRTGTARSLSPAASASATAGRQMPARARQATTQSANPASRSSRSRAGGSDRRCIRGSVWKSARRRRAARPTRLDGGGEKERERERRHEAGEGVVEARIRAEEQHECDRPEEGDRPPDRRARDRRRGLARHADRRDAREDDQVLVVAPGVERRGDGDGEESRERDR